MLLEKALVEPIQHILEQLGLVEYILQIAPQQEVVE
jgi:hypothetical protein